MSVLDALIKAGADLDQTDEDRQTSLMKAAERNNLEMVEALVVAGADINARDKNGESAWDKTTNVDVEDLLTLYGAAVSYSDILVEPSSETSED